MMRLTATGKWIVATQLFRLFFGGYLAGKDQYAYNDTGSAVTVLAIYFALGVFTVLYLFGKRFGLIGITGLTVILVILHTVFIVVALAGGADPAAHSPVENLWATILRYVFSLVTLVLAARAFREHAAG